MTYRNNKSYLAFNTTIRGEKASSIAKDVDTAIIENENKDHLQDQLAVSESQDVYKSLE